MASKIDDTTKLYKLLLWKREEQKIRVGCQYSVCEIRELNPLNISGIIGRSIINGVRFIFNIIIVSACA